MVWGTADESTVHWVESHVCAWPGAGRNGPAATIARSATSAVTPATSANLFNGFPSSGARLTSLDLHQNLSVLDLNFI